MRLGSSPSALGGAKRTGPPLHNVDAEGCHFIDAAGKRYLDFSSQLMCVNLGHKNLAVIDAIMQQARILPYIAPAYATSVRAELSQLLLEVLPKGLTKFFFTTSGTGTERGGNQDRADGHRQDENRRPLSLVPWVNHGVHRRDRRSTAVAPGAWRQGPGCPIRPRNPLLSLPAAAHLSWV
jgi:hypothetical protein